MSDIIERAQYIDAEDKLVIKTTYDNSALIEQNKVERNASPEIGRYKGNFVKVGSLHEGDIVRLRNMGYNLLSPDPAEVRRALCYIQENERAFLTVEGKPFAKVRNKWA